MLGLLWRLIIGRFHTAPVCQHRWEILDSGEIRSKAILDTEYKRQGVIYILRCSVCGEITTRRAKV